MSKYEVKEGAVLESFEDVSEWTISTGTAENDTTHVKTGSKSLKLVSTEGGNCYATKTVDLDVSGAAQLYFWVYIENVLDISSLQVILSDTTDFSSYFTYSPTSSFLHNGWNKMMYHKARWASSGSPSWDNAMVRLRVRVNAATGKSPVVYFDSLVHGEYTRPKCIITFDDGWMSQYLYGYTYMRKLGFRGVDYIIPGYVDVDENYATTEQVQEMYDYGWDICVHDSGNWRDDYDDVELLATQIKSVKEFIQSKGWNRNESNRHAAYPQGGWDDVVIGAMQAADMLTGRMIVNRTQANEIEDPLFLVRQSIIHTTSLETATGYIDRTIADGGAILLNFHKLEPTTVDIDTEILIETFEGIMDYLSQKREVIDVVTLTEWYRGITNARKSI